MSKLFRFRAAFLVAVGLGVTVEPVEAAKVRGSFDNLEVSVAGKPLGLTRTRVAAPSEDAVRLRRNVALFLAVKNGESLPIPSPKKHQIITIDGLRFSPNIASCASDAQVSFVNADREPVSVLIDDSELGVIAPGAQKTYVCSPGKATRTVRIREWPHMRALVYVGEVGVAGLPSDRGRFSIDAPRGSYELQVIDRDGLIINREVKVDGRDVDLGKLDVATSGNRGKPQGE